MNSDFPDNTCAVSTSSNNNPSMSKRCRNSNNDNRQNNGKRHCNHENFNEDDYDEDGYDEDGYDEDGYDRIGYNRDGYDINGYDKDGYDKDGYDEDGYDEDGYDREGYDENGFDSDGFSKNDNDEDDALYGINIGNDMENSVDASPIEIDRTLIPIDISQNFITYIGNLLQKYDLLRVNMLNGSLEEKFHIGNEISLVFSIMYCIDERVFQADEIIELTYYMLELFNNRLNHNNLDINTSRNLNLAISTTWKFINRLTRAQIDVHIDKISSMSDFHGYNEHITRYQNRSNLALQSTEINGYKSLINDFDNNNI